MAVVVVVLAGGLATAQNHLQHALQSAVDRAMAGQSGAAVVLEVGSRRVLAQHRLDVAARRLAAPGSAIKPFTLLALLNSGHFDPQGRFYCRRTLRIAAQTMDCTHPEVPAGFDASEALAYSCNSYFASSAAHLAAENLRQEFQRAGLLSPTGIAAQEAVGSMHNPGNREQLQLMALGEEGIAVTPLGLLNAYRGLALRQTASNSDAVWAVVSQGLKGSTEYGMAHAAQPEGLAVAGKTGTARSTTSPLTHGWFAGYAPADHPEIVLVIYLDHARGMDAAALARKIFTAYQQARGTR
jgi:penicillin-binding protein 2